MINANQRLDHFALYGNISLIRGFCNHCKSNSFIIDNKFNCCERKTEAKPEKTVRFSEPEDCRRSISPEEKDEILKLQDNRCLYCDREFGSFFLTKAGVLKQLNIHFDHFIPFAYSQNNYAYNFVAACHVCNGAKSDMMFNTIDEAKIYIKQTVEKKRGIEWL